MFFTGLEGPSASALTPSPFPKPIEPGERQLRRREDDVCRLWPKRKCFKSWRRERNRHRTFSISAKGKKFLKQEDERNPSVHSAWTFWLLTPDLHLSGTQMQRQPHNGSNKSPLFLCHVFIEFPIVTHMWSFTRRKVMHFKARTNIILTAYMEYNLRGHSIKETGLFLNSRILRIW